MATSFENTPLGIGVKNATPGPDLSVQTAYRSTRSSSTFIGDNGKFE